MENKIMENPFSISFGREPKELIDRSMELGTITDVFNREYSTSQVFLITGVRGSGKTVSLTKLYDEFSLKDNWIVIEINSSDNMLEELASKLYENKTMHKHFVKAEINLSAFGIGINIKNVPPISHISTALEKMLKEVKAQNKKLLVCIDEATNTNNMKLFVSTFQILIRHNLPIYLLMTGLYQNIDDLQNEDALTFLLRAPKIKLDKLNILSIANSYEKIFNIDNKKAIELAKLTNGYAFAYQLLGYLCFENKTTDIKKIIKDFDIQLAQLVYEKIWSELTAKEKDVCIAMAKGNNKIKDVRQEANIGSGTMSTYRLRLARKGIIDIETYGEVSFALPRFKEVIIDTLIYL